MTTIPADIWLHVAHFIPSNELCSLFSVNSTFFQLAMDIRYHEARFHCFDDAAALERTHRFRDPVIAHRVRRVDINPEHWAVSWNRHQRLSDDPGHISGSSQEYIRTIADTIACLTNVTEFSIDLKYLPFRMEDLLPFLKTAWETFGSSLLEFSFNGRAHYLLGLISTAEGFAALRHLHICILPRPASSVPEDVLVILTTCLAPFVNKVAPTLRSLSLNTEGLDLGPSPFFLQLMHIPDLECLALSINHGVDFLSDPLGLPRFLRNHAASLRHFYWNENYVSFLSWEADQCFANWLSKIELDNAILSNLHTLCMPVPESSGFPLTVQFILRSAATLTSLELWNHTLSYKEVDILVSVLAPPQTGKLRRLILRVQHLFPELILLLAKTLPRLEELSVRINWVGQLNGSQEKTPVSPDEELLFERNFADTMRTYDIRDWSLRNIEISVPRFYDTKIGQRLMRVLAECVPSTKIP